MFEYVMLKSIQDFDEVAGKDTIVDFFFEHLDRFGDSKEAIGECIDYVMSSDKGKGGYILLALKDGDIAGGVVMISTGMKLYIPEYFLVYIAVHSGHRNQGLGGKLLKIVQDKTNGDIALHVEYDNPAKRLYERSGFESKYAEMRYLKE